MMRTDGYVPAVGLGHREADPGDLAANAGPDERTARNGLGYRDNRATVGAKARAHG